VRKIAVMIAAYGATRAIAESQFMADLSVTTLHDTALGRLFPPFGLGSPGFLKLDHENLTVSIHEFPYHNPNAIVQCSIARYAWSRLT
jgi:hypothetical protein